MHKDKVSATFHNRTIYKCRRFFTLFLCPCDSGYHCAGNTAAVMKALFAVDRIESICHMAPVVEKLS
jgi:hypothetical protein